ncbi:(Fe-S)-binding protein [Halothiobacillus sp. DCM-1]|uniref:(Fe-S)-binding protein n=1 Tax=Halothiobacillus sp. DCM-1 TaxID=3112558 RepID=UPI0032501541
MNQPYRTETPQPDWATVKQSALSCVMCGLCLPHCPTFARQQNEAQGPRGRVSLMLGLAEGQLTADASILESLDGCLTCRACEAACPSKVPYGALIDDTRALLASQTPVPVSQRQPWRWLRDVVFSQRQRMGRLSWLAHGLDRLTPLWRRLGGRLTAALPSPLPPPYLHPVTARKTPPKPAQERPCVALFIGCMGSSLGADVSRAAEQVLDRLGFVVWTPPQQACCGAMHQHGGDPAQAAALRETNRALFATAPNLAAIVVINTACAVELARASFEVPVIELTQFLADMPDERWPALSPIPATLAVHLPCSQQRALKQSGSTARLLRRIPGLTLHSLASNRLCCGAAGMHALMNPDEAAALRAPLLAEIAALDASAVSCNIGCAAHLSAGLQQPVKHPVEWIAAALPPAPSSSMQ